MPLINFQGLLGFIPAARRAGTNDKRIVDRIIGNASFDQKLRDGFKNARSTGYMSDTEALDYILSKRPAAITAEQFKPKTALEKVAALVGPERAGKSAGAGLAMLDPKHRENISEGLKSGVITPEESKILQTAGVTTPELLGSTAQTALTVASPFFGKAISSGRLGSQVLKQGIAGGAFGASGAAAGGGDLKDVGRGAAFGSVLGAAIPLVGAGVRKVSDFFKDKVPEKLYSQIFKNAQDDFASWVKSGAIDDMRANNPALFKEYVKKGILKVDLSGKVVGINPTLVREAIDMGLKGSDVNMAKYSYQKMLDLENQVREAVKRNGATVTLTDKRGIIETLEDFGSQFKRGVLSPRKAETDVFIQILKQADGDTIPADVALDLRRFLDNMRNTSSFKTNANLVGKQEEFRVASDTVRKSLNSIPGMGDLMNDYRKFIEFFDALVDYGVKRGNSRLLNFTDILVGGGGLASGFPGTGIGMASGIRLFQSPAIQTGLGQFLDKSGKFTTGLGQSALGQNLKQAGAATTRTILGQSGKLGE